MKIRKLVGFVLMMAVSWVILEITGASPANFLVVRDFAATANVTLVPFADILDLVNGGSLSGMLLNIGGNIALFMPLGFMLPMVWTGFRRLPRTAAFGACVSLFIEVSQLFNYRATVTDDLLLTPAVQCWAICALRQCCASCRSCHRMTTQNAAASCLLHLRYCFRIWCRRYRKVYFSLLTRRIFERMPMASNP